MPSTFKNFASTAILVWARSRGRIMVIPASSAYVPRAGPTPTKWRFSLTKDVPSIEALTRHGAQITCTREPQVFLDRMFYLNGDTGDGSSVDYPRIIKGPRTETGYPIPG